MRALLVIPTLVGIAAIYAFLDGDAGVRTWWTMRSELAATRARNAELRSEVAHLRGEVRSLEGDPFAVERAIREDLGLARPGETVVRLRRPGGSTPRFP